MKEFLNELHILLPIAATFALGLYNTVTQKRSKSQEISVEQKKLDVTASDQQVTNLLAEIVEYRKEHAEHRAEFNEWKAEREAWHAEKNTLTEMIISLRLKINRLIILLDKNNIEVPEEAHSERL